MALPWSVTYTQFFPHTLYKIFFPNIPITV
nr:MAG TPA: hypothetical protein [Caudoviricetes sp.]